MSFECSLLEDVAEVIDSLHKTPSYCAQGFPMVRVTDVKYGNLNLSGCHSVDEGTYLEFSRRFKPKAGDIVITRVGTYGVSARVTEANFCLGQNTAAIIPKLINPRYLYAALNSEFVRSQIEAGVVGSTQKTLSLKHIKALNIPRQGDETEESIAEIIGGLDDRISLLRETNATLEAIAQALFKSWFVDFDPVRAKAEGLEPEGMDAATAALFPDSFEESELGLVPKGWKVGSIGDIAVVKGGFAFKSNVFCESGIPVVKIKNIVGDGTVDLENVQYVDHDQAQESKKFSLQDGDILMAMTGATIGKTGVVVTCEGETPLLNQRVAKFDPKLSKQSNSWLVYTAFQNLFMIDQIVNAASGSAQANISTTGIESARLVLPINDEVLKAFDDIASIIFSGWIENHKRVKTLTQIRDTLLPRLISGQMRLPETEAPIDNMLSVAV